MAQRSPLTITNTTAPLVRQELNDSFEVLQSSFSGPNAPSNPVEGQNWFRTTDKKYFVYRNGNWDEVGGSSVSIATTDQVTTGTNDLTAVSPLKLRQNVGALASSSDVTNANTVNVTKRFTPKNIVDIAIAHGDGDISNDEFQALITLLFEEDYQWNFVGNVSNDGEAILSTDNTGVNSKFGSTTFLFLRNNVAPDLLNNISAGDGFIIELGNQAIMGEISGVDQPANENGTRLWTNDELWTKNLDQWGELGTGNGTVYFARSLAEKLSTYDIDNHVDGLVTVKDNQVGMLDWDDIRAKALGPSQKSITIGTFDVVNSLPSTAGKYYYNSNILNITWSSETEEDLLDDFLTPGERFHLGSWEFKIGAIVNKNTVPNGGFGFDVTTITGTPPTTNDQVLQANGRLVRWDDPNLYDEILPDASTTVKGKAEIATLAECNTGTDNTRIVSPLQLRNQVGLQVTSQEITDATSTAIKRYSPANIKSFIDTHATGGGGAVGQASQVTKTQITNVGETYTDLITGANDDDYYEVTFEGASSTETGNVAYRTIGFRFGDLSTSDRWISVRGGSGGQRFDIKRVATGSKIQVKRSSNVDSTNSVTAYKLAIEDLPEATETVKGILERSSQTEATEATDNSTAMTPLRVKESINNQIPSASSTAAGKIEISTNTEIDASTPSSTLAVSPSGLRHAIGTKISSAERSADNPTTNTRRFSPADIKFMVEHYSEGEITDADFFQGLIQDFPETSTLNFVSTLTPTIGQAKITTGATQTFGSTVYLSLITQSSAVTSAAIDTDNSVIIAVGATNKIFADVLGTTTNGSQETRIWLSAARWASGSNTFSTLGTGVGKVYWHRNYFSTLNDTIQVQPVGVISSNAVGRFNTYKFGDIVNQVAGSQSKETTIGTFEYSATKPTTAGKFYFASNKLYLTWNGNLQETTLRQYLSDGQRFSLGSWTFAVIDGLAKGTIAQGGYNIDVATISGSAPTSGTQTLKVFGKFLAWSDTTARNTEHFNTANSMLQAGANVTKTPNSTHETITLSVTFPDGNTQQKGLVETATNSEMNSGLSTSPSCYSFWGSICNRCQRLQVQNYKQALKQE